MVIFRNRSKHECTAAMHAFRHNAAARRRRHLRKAYVRAKTHLKPRCMPRGRCRSLAVQDKYEGGSCTNTRHLSGPSACLRTAVSPTWPSQPSQRPRDGRAR